MTTKIANVSCSATDQAKPTIYNQARMATQAIMGGSTYMMGPSQGYLPCPSTAAVVYVCEKSAEAQRQIDRVRSLSAICINNRISSEKCLKSVSSAVTLIGAFLSSPIPIPVASGSEDGDTSLFLDDDGVYGDIEISGTQVEYYLKIDRNGNEMEYFGTEEIEDGFIPPKLLTRLFYHYAPK
ncbi:hypothetical protein K5P26_04720 [Sphingopyxis sp. XHP0097]|uniref:Uncharacterized protein n=1 Tax=Sphingopyxis jiangsuensis TaxID=2871171 RepID=A0ABS7MBN7_9SPHN|nr:hypothetical protein [Sphingopyxis jiangsuensis]MBY4636442.1 hypothetical protein [Sphingopyxis jiangsuensis]